MEKKLFAAHLHAAVHHTLAFTRTQCWNTLAGEVDFLIQPDNPDEHAPYLNKLEKRRFKARKQEVGTRFSVAEVVERLWVAGQVPVWINISVYQARRRTTTIELLHDRRLAFSPADIYHQREGYPPFHVQVSVPSYHYDQNFQPKTSKFNVNWQRWPWRLWLPVTSRWLLFRYRRRFPGI